MAWKKIGSWCSTSPIVTFGGVPPELGNRLVFNEKKPGKFRKGGETDPTPDYFQ
jgi:hypothetical protein